MKELLISTEGYDGTSEGWKTLTSRLGDRSKEYSVGDILLYKENQVPFRERKIRITSISVKYLRDLSDDDAVSSNNTDKISAIVDFTSLYVSLGKEVNADSLITLIGYEKL